MLVKNKFGIIRINNNTNNTFISILTFEKKVLFSAGTGILNLKKAKRSTTFAAQTLAFFLGVKSYKLGIRFVQVFCKGFGKNRDSALKGVLLANLKIILIKDFTKIPFNGCKQKKKRRI
jgi:small subunit ribosomal protein S11